jgi:hypothetical protein
MVVGKMVASNKVDEFRSRIVQYELGSRMFLQNHQNINWKLEDDWTFSTVFHALNLCPEQRGVIFSWEAFYGIFYLLCWVSVLVGMGLTSFGETNVDDQ